MRKGFGLEQLLDGDATQEARRAIVAIELLSFSVVVFTGLCCAYYVAIERLRPIVHVLFG